ncbi:Rhodopsin domain-containing protein [Madurella fahalii]|uniref:Rhodopsin domain-containing protein n=1 Tax=Madurella fahalii TaxID=1157608 RepID=A0ABQ0GGD4_9PEZI
MSETAAAYILAFTANPYAPLPGAAQSIGETGLLAIVWVFFSTATIFVALRLTVRFRQNRSFLFDDYWIMFAWLCLLTMAILQTEQMPSLWYITYLGAGRITPDEDTIPRTEQLSRWQFPIIKLFWTVLWSVKASFMAVFFRFVKPFPILRRLWYCAAIFAFLAYVGCWLASSLTCSPPSDYFKAGACSSPHEIWMQKFNVIYSTTVDVTSDLIIMALPIAILPSLQLDFRRKMGLGIAFSLGAIIISVAIVRMTQVISATGGTVDLIGLATWGAIETSTAVIVGSLPPLKALLSRSVKKYSSRNKSRYATGMTHQAAGANSHGDYGPHSVSRTVMVAESIPLDDMHTSNQKNGGIYIQRTYETTVEFDEASSRDDDEVGIVNKGHAL